MQPGDVLLARHPAVHDPNPLRHPEAGLHCLDDLLDRCYIHPVTGKDFVTQGNPLPCDHQSNADLLAVRTVIAAISPFGQRISLSLPLEIGARHIVEKQVVLEIEELT